MRRVIMALLATTMGTVLLVGLKSQVLGAPLGLAADAPLDPADPGSTAAGDGGGGAPAPGQTTGPKATTGPGTKPGTTPSPGSSTTKPTATTPGQTTTTTTTAPPPTSQTFTGSAIAVKTAQSPTATGGTCGDCHDYSMTVTITVSGGKITKTTTSYTSPGASLSYCTKAINKLTPLIITAQKWNLGQVSGATYSGNAWELSVKSAMAKAGLPT